MISGFKNILNFVSPIWILKKPIELCQICIEVCKSINEEAHNNAKNEQVSYDKTSQKLEEIYIEACKKVTKQESENLTKRLDYKLINFSLYVIREIAELTEKTISFVKEKTKIGLDFTKKLNFKIANSAKQLFYFSKRIPKHLMRFFKYLLKFCFRIFKESLKEANKIIKKEIHKSQNSQNLKHTSLMIGDNYRNI